MKKEEILKFIKESNNLKLDLKKALTDENLNFDWKEFFELYYEYFGEAKWENLLYVENGESIGFKSDEDEILSIVMNENNEIEIELSESTVKSTGDTIITNLNLLFEMFEKFNREIGGINNSINKFFCEQEDENVINNKLV